ncbi:hypothetical protein BH23PAT2_BH23PAT2_05260 [soil metagenome]
MSWSQQRVRHGPHKKQNESIKRGKTPKEAQAHKGHWPEIRIVRETNIDDVSSGPDWDHFLSQIGRKNIGKAKAPSLGSVFLTLVSAQEMGRMLQAKNPKAFDGRTETTKLMARTAKRFEATVSQNEKTKLDILDNWFLALSDLRLAQLEDPDALFLDLEGRAHAVDVDDVQRECAPTTDYAWSPGSFTCGALEKYSRNEMGIDLSGNQELLDERLEIQRYLGSIGLQTRMMDGSWKPHLTVLQTYDNIGATELYVPKAPEEILLDKPKALVNRNSPVQ